MVQYSCNRDREVVSNLKYENVGWSKRTRILDLGTCYEVWLYQSIEM